MSAERMAEIEARLADLRGHHPHFNDYGRAERAFVTYAPIDLRWLLDRVRELEGTLVDIQHEAWRPIGCTMVAFIASRNEIVDMASEVLSEADSAAARSPSGEGQP